MEKLSIWTASVRLQPFKGMICGMLSELISYRTVPVVQCGSIMQHVNGGVALARFYSFDLHSCDSMRGSADGTDVDSEMFP